jgi:hypothetical protein
MVIEPVSPMERCEFDRLAGFPRRAAVNQLGFVQPVDRLGQGIVATVAATAHRGFDTRLGQSLGLANADVLGSAIRVMNERISVGLSVMQYRLQCVQNKVCLHGPADPPAHDSRA